MLLLQQPGVGTQNAIEAFYPPSASVCARVKRMCVLFQRRTTHAFWGNNKSYFMGESNFSFPLRQEQVNMSVCVHIFFLSLTAGEGERLLVALLMECCQMLAEGQGP